jgi:hypothetical protein
MCELSHSEQTFLRNSVPVGLNADKTSGGMHPMRMILAALAVLAVLVVTVPTVAHASHVYLFEPNNNQGSNS